jgi:hypothetical protein
MKRRTVLLCLFICYCVATGLAALQDQPRPLRSISANFLIPECGTHEDRSRQLRRTAMTFAADGEPLMFLQDPAVLAPDWQGRITLRQFSVVGDHPTVQFALADPEQEANALESWTRVGTRSVDGQLISIFEPSWPDAVLARMLRREHHGFDRPLLYWGAVLIPGGDTRRHIYVRIASRSLPVVHSTKIDDQAQFTSHIVNLVIPEFGDSRISTNDIDLRGVARRFYEHFQDEYDSLAIIPQASLVDTFQAYHRNVSNRVQGIGERIFDTSTTYGSNHVLQSVELYRQANFALNSTSSHEIGHQWGAYFDWSRISGISRAGHVPTSHDPLWAQDATLLGAVLTPRRRVRSTTDGAWTIERTPAPIRHHPLLLYAMGKLPPEDVPQLTLFDDQAQFEPDTASEPAPGTLVTGGHQSVTVFAAIGAYGPRSGPSPDVWRRATIVVSRDALLSQRELDYWTYFAQRLEDPQKSGVISYDGHPSFDEAVWKMVDLQTGIKPKVLSAIVQPLPVDNPSFGPMDWRGVVFDAPVPSHYDVRRRVRVSGRVTAEDRRDFDDILVRFWKYGGAEADAIRVWGRIRSRGNFDLDFEFRDGQQGRYIMEVFLFWPKSGAQYPRGQLTPIIVK